MPRLMTAVATTTGAILTHAVQGLPAAQRSWGLAMLAELEEIPDPREAASWALGSLWVVWSRRQRAWWRAAWRFETDWRAWRAHPIAPVPVPVLVVVAAAVVVRVVAGTLVEALSVSDLGVLVVEAFVLNLAGRVEASLHPHPMYTRMLPRGDIADRTRRLPWVAWQVSAPVSVVCLVAWAGSIVWAGPNIPPALVVLYLGYWFLVWPQLATRIALRRHGWTDPRAHAPFGR